MPQGGTLFFLAVRRGEGSTDAPDPSARPARGRLRAAGRDRHGNGAWTRRPWRGPANPSHHETLRPGHGAGAWPWRAASRSSRAAASRSGSAPGEGAAVTLWLPQDPGSTPGAQDSARRRRPGRPPPTPRGSWWWTTTPACAPSWPGNWRTRATGSWRRPTGWPRWRGSTMGEAVDVLVTDLSMPGINGLVLIEEARRRRADLPRAAADRLRRSRPSGPAVEHALGGRRQRSCCGSRCPATTWPPMPGRC